MTEQSAQNQPVAAIPGYFARKRSALYSSALSNRYTRHAMSGVSALGLGYGAYKTLDWLTADSTFQTLENGIAFAGVAALSHYLSFRALEKAAKGDRVSLHTARALANGTGIGCFLALVPLCAALMPHIPVVDALDSVKTAIAYVPAFLLAVPIGHFYKNFVRRNDLHPEAPKEKPAPAPEKTFAEKQAEYEQGKKERDEEKEKRSRTERRERWSGLLTRLAATAAFTGFLCYSDQSFPRDSLSLEAVGSYLVNNGPVVALYGALGGFISAGFLEKKAKLLYGAAWAGASLTALAAFNGYDVTQIKDVFSGAAAPVTNYIESLLKTPWLAAGLGIGYLKWPHAMNNLIVHGIPNTLRFAGRYYYDPKTAAKGALSYMASLKFWGGVGGKGADMARAVTVTAGKWGGAIALPLTALEIFKQMGLSPVGGIELGGHLLGAAGEAINFSGPGVANKMIQFGNGIVANVMSGDIQFKVIKAFSAVASGYAGAIGGKWAAQKIADKIGRKVDIVVDEINRPKAPVEPPAPAI